MQLDLTEEETAALTRLLTNTLDADRYPAVTAHSDLEGNTRQDPTGTGARAVTAGEALRAAALHFRATKR